jgi:hypothetical protein
MVVAKQSAAISAGANASAPGAGAAATGEGLGELSGPAAAEVVSLFLASGTMPAVGGTKDEGIRDKGKGSSSEAETEVEGEVEVEGDTETETETETEVEEETDTETEGDAETETEVEGEGHLEKGLLKALAGEEHKALRKRLASVFKQNKGFKEELKALKSAEAVAPVVLQANEGGSGGGALLADVATEADLEKLGTAAETWLEWCEDNAEGGTPPGAKEEMTRDEVKARKREASRILKAVPARREYLAKYQASHKAVVAALPDMAKVGSELHTKAMAVLKANPALVSSPTYLQDVADLIRGRELREEEAKGTKYVKVKGANPGAGARKDTETSRNGGSGTPTKAKGANGAVVRTAPTGAAVNGVDWRSMRSRAEAGDPKAQAAIAGAFVETL